MGIVALKHKVIVCIVKNALIIPLERHAWQRACVARQLLRRLLEVIKVEVCIAKRMDELAHLQAALLGNHHREQRIRSDIKGHAQEDIATALIQLTR